MSRRLFDLRDAERCDQHKQQQQLQADCELNERRKAEILPTASADDDAIACFDTRHAMAHYSTTTASFYLFDTTTSITGCAAIAVIARRISQARQFPALAAFCKNNQLDQRMSRAFLIVAALCAFHSDAKQIIDKLKKRGERPGAGKTFSPPDFSTS